MGRPVAIVRIGSRTPIAEGMDEIKGQCSPIQIYDAMAIPPEDESMVADVPNAMFENSDELPIGSGCTCPPICRADSICTPRQYDCIPQYRRDEFICDGDDGDLKVTLDAERNVHGLDIEETVAHFDSRQNGTLIVPSNRICIYAPRFAAIRRILDAGSTQVMQRWGATVEKTPVDLTVGNEFAASSLQNVQLQANHGAYRASLLRERTRGVTADNVLQLVGSQSAFKPYEDFQLTRFGRVTGSETARLGLALQSAKVWQDNLAAQLTVKGAKPIIVEDVYQLQEVVQFESDAHPAIRLCKLASRISAHPGDTIDFTIRFDNLGRERIENLTILDNLSPRLEYVVNSAECTQDAEFSASENKAGSTILRWQIRQPVEIGKGGLIRFQCRLR
jgi:uncharacterized repeat protein (TIGR01451 family)